MCEENVVVNNNDKICMPFYTSHDWNYSIDFSTKKELKKLFRSDIKSLVDALIKDLLFSIEQKTLRYYKQLEHNEFNKDLLMFVHNAVMTATNKLYDECLYNFNVDNIYKWDYEKVEKWAYQKRVNTMSLCKLSDLGLIIHNVVCDEFIDIMESKLKSAIAKKEDALKELKHYKEQLKNAAK